MLIDIDNISKDYTKKNILVIGDIILDAYEFGKVDRISQEAPVPIVAIDRKSHKPGGAANVALNLSGLGVTVELIGIAGDDNNHDELQRCFKHNDNINLRLVKDKSRPTSVKTRIIADGKQVARLDEEDTNDINSELEQELKNIFDLKFANADGIIIEDYNKGTLTKDVILIFGLDSKMVESILSSSLIDDPNIVFNLILPSTLTNLFDRTFSKPLMTLMVTNNEKTPIAKPMVARLIAFDEKLLFLPYLKYRRTNCRYNLIINFFLASLLEIESHLLSSDYL